MPFDVPGGAGGFGGSVGNILLGGLQSLVNQGVGALSSRLQSTQGSGDDGMGPVIETGVVGSPQGSMNGVSCGCGPDPCQLPDYIARGSESMSYDPCFPRPSQRTITNTAGCKVTIPVWAKKRRKPRMNPLNPRALSRSLRRVSGFARAAKRSRTSINKAARAIK